jgi:hypothetical protein
VSQIAPVKSKKGLTSFTVSFNEPLNASSASNLGLYHVFGGVKKRGKLVFSKALAIKSASSSGGGSTVTINLAKPFSGKVEVQVQGTITAANGASSSINATMNL